MLSELRHEAKRLEYSSKVTGWGSFSRQLPKKTPKLSLKNRFVKLFKPMNLLNLEQEFQMPSFCLEARAAAQQGYSQSESVAGTPLPKATGSPAGFRTTGAR